MCSAVSHLWSCTQEANESIEQLQSDNTSLQSCYDHEVEASTANRLKLQEVIKEKDLLILKLEKRSAALLLVFCFAAEQNCDTLCPVPLHCSGGGLCISSVNAYGKAHGEEGQHSPWCILLSAFVCGFVQGIGVW